MRPAAELLFLLLALPLAAACAYLLVLTLLSRAPPPPPAPVRRTRFDIVVPAHDEAAGIAAVVASLLRIDWPDDRLRVLVVADNCTDATAALARAAGAEVLERTDPLLRGKGHALAFAFADSRAACWADAVVVVDADAEVSPNLLSAFASRLQAGALAVQAHHGVLNAQDSWRTQLMAIALSAFHRVRSRGRERLGLSCGLRGNGWCVSHALLRRRPCAAFSLAEDVEYGIELGLAGVRVHHADEASVNATMVSGEVAARSQRQRWESGRWQLLRTRLGPLLRGVARPGGVLCLDLLVDLLVPPLSWLALGVAVLLLLGLGLALGDGGSASAVAVALACAAALAAHVLRGWQLSGVGRRGLAALARAPGYVLWKLLLMLRQRAGGGAEWVRTQREKP